ncbi:SMR family transporter [Maritimibacter alkaliphilus]|jgi:small multidrug resistance pump|uniref:SMR family transporter n=1 Tax=Maritimibacter alkaliphilus TaxID=404236 RepID=UPI001C95AE6D|nr:SMR family transporter [Maritimibacter alkaliphilus]MBY6090068.1 QacE family quaternary ammonium compound efflux SMR transporter [Maritimibacter alkaliphilus]
MSATLGTYLTLAIAVAFEVVGTTFLQASQQFTRLVPTIMVAVCYAAAFYFLAQVLKTMPVGVAYAIWSGLGILMVSAIGLVVFGQKLDLPAVIGLMLIVAGILVVNLFSNATTH